MPKIEIGKKYKTRDGREVIIFTTKANGIKTVVGQFRLSDNHARGLKEEYRWKICGWYSDGRAFDDEIKELDELDLVEVKQTKTVWVNVYESFLEDDDVELFAYASKSLADDDKFENRIACVPLTFTGGEGLEEEE